MKKEIWQVKTNFSSEALAHSVPEPEPEVGMRNSPWAFPRGDL